MIGPRTPDRRGLVPFGVIAGFSTRAGAVARVGEWERRGE